MSSRDLHSKIVVATAFNTQTIGSVTTTTGVIIDTDDYLGLEFVMLSGTITNGTFTVKLEDGDDSGLSDAADVDSDFLLGALPDISGSGESNRIRRVGYVGKKRYIRLSIVSTGTVDGIISAIAIKYLKTSEPTPEQAT